MKYFLLLFLLSATLVSCKEEQPVDLQIVQASSDLTRRDTVLKGHPLGLNVVVALPNSCTEFRSPITFDSSQHVYTFHAKGATAGGICTQQLTYYQEFGTVTMPDTGTYYLRADYPTVTYLDTIIVR